MFTGGNPFEAGTTFRLATVPQVRVAAIDGDVVSLVLECIAAGETALVLQRANLKVGDILTINDLTIQLSVTHKE